MKVDVTVFEVSPIADPSRGGRWADLQLWDEPMGIPKLIATVKVRIEEKDARATIDEATKWLVALAAELP